MGALVKKKEHTKKMAKNGPCSRFRSPDPRKILHNTFLLKFSTNIPEERMGIRCGVLQGHSDEVLDCTVNKHGTLILSGSEDDTLRLWNAKRCT